MTVRTTGTVIDMKVRQDGVVDVASFHVMDSSSGSEETFVLWSSAVAQITPFSVWVARSLVVSLLRDALVNKLEVTVQHDDTSALAQWVQLSAS